MKRTLLAFGAAGFLSAAIFQIGVTAEPAAKPAKAVLTALSDETDSGAYAFLRKNRRDPFAMRLDGSGPIGPDVNKPVKILTIQEQEAKVEECERLLVQMIADIQQKKFGKVVTAYEKITRIRAIVTNKTLRARVEKLRAKASATLDKNRLIQHAVILANAKDSLEKMRKSFATKQYSVVIAEYRKIEGALKKVQANNPELQMRTDAVKTEATNLWKRANIRQEFLRRKPIIGGVFIIGPKNRSVIIDNMPVMQGEKHGDYTVHKVEQNRITFAYKGELIEQDLD